MPPKEPPVDNQNSLVPDAQFVGLDRQASFLRAEVLGRAVTKRAFSYASLGKDPPEYFPHMLTLMHQFAEMSRKETMESRKALRKQAAEPWFALDFVNEYGQVEHRTEYIHTWARAAEIMGVSPNSLQVSMSKWNNHTIPFGKRLQPMADPPSDAYRMRLYPAVIYKMNENFAPDTEKDFIRTENPDYWLSDSRNLQIFKKQKEQTKRPAPKIQNLNKQDRGLISLYVRDNWNK